MERLKGLFLIAAMAAAVAAASPAYPADLTVHGFLQGNYSLDTEGRNPDGGQFKWSEERGQIKLDGTSEQFHALIKQDLFYDNIESNAGGELREGYADYTGSAWDMRLGRQIITWGVGDLIFINDVFPKDYEAFFSGRPLEYLKGGVDGVKIGLYPEILSLELAVIPFFRPDKLPTPERFWLFNPMPGITNVETAEPATTLKNTQVALRAYREIAGFDTSLYFYRGFFTTPSMRPDNLSAPTKITQFFPELSVYGLSLQKSTLGGVLSLEWGYYDSLDDISGTDPFIPNSTTRFLIGYQRQVIEDFTIGVQYSGEYMHEYSAYKASLPPGFPQDPLYRQLASLRLTYLLMNQNLKLSWFSFYGITDEDYYLNPEVRYNFTDHVWGAVGANIFGGRIHTTEFGSLYRNDNTYVQIRYEL